MKPFKWAMVITASVLLFLYLPILVLLLNSFNASRFGGTWEGWSLKWYRLLLLDTELWHACKNTLLIALSTTLCSTLLGSFAALCLRVYQGRLQKMHGLLIYTPLVVPEVHIGISLMLFFVLLNIPLGLSTIFLAHTTFCISYVTMVMLASFEELDFAMVEAAVDLGARWPFILRRVMLPLLLPGLSASALLAFTLSLDDFVITFFVAGPGSTTLPLHIYSMTKYGSPPLINALSALLLIATFAAAWTTQRLLYPSSRRIR